VVVVGAGPAGCVTALLLARLGAHVALIADPSSAAGRPLVGEVVPPAARPAFERLGLGTVLDDAAHRPTAGMVPAWGPGEAAVIDQRGSPLGPAVQLDRRAFDGRLLAAAQRAGATVVERPRATWPSIVSTVGVPGGPAVIVDATGRVASLARAAGWSLARADRLVAIVGILERRPAGTGGIADDPWLRLAATPDGWWSSMVLPDGARVAAFHSDADLRATRVMADPGRWWATLTGMSGLGAVIDRGTWQPPAALHLVAADSRRASPPPLRAGAAGRVVPVGDAEMAFDPLSAFGILGAISSAEEALPAIAARMDGDAAAREATARREAARDHRWTRYRERLATAYADETRWRSAPFWARRRAPAPPAVRGM
jgi:flavin-dependent dehydrogenase